MGRVSGTVQHRDGSLASGRRVSAVASGSLGGMIGPVSTDSRGRFTLTWSSATGLAKLFIDGNERLTQVRDGADVTISL